MQDLNVKARPVHQRAKERHLIDLEGLFVKMVEYRLKPDPRKRVFGIEAGKLMGFLLTERGMKTNLERCAMTRRMRMSVLSGFAPVGGGGGLPYQECKEAFIMLKEYLASPQVLCKPQPSTPLNLYLAVIDQPISSVLVHEWDQFQKPICFVSEVWQGLEERYQVPEKTALVIPCQPFPRWAGPFRVTEALRDKAYRLETLEEGAVPHTWNAVNFKFYFSYAKTLYMVLGDTLFPL